MSGFDLCGRSLETGKGQRVRIEDGVIVRVEATDDPGDYFLGPGMIDLQVNGSGGLDVNADDVSVSTIVALTERMLQQGVTTYAPTIISATEEKICHVLSVIAAARRTAPHVKACVPFVHLEGPHISALEGYRGAHDPAVVRPPSIAEFERCQAAGEGCVGLVTMSPHYAESATYITHLTCQGVRVALGHTHADAAQIREAVEAGARISTHLGNGLPAKIPRHNNPLWPQLANANLLASVIADGHHLPADLLLTLLKSKGEDGVYLVTDAVTLAGMPAGTYNTPVGGRVDLREDGRLCISGTELLAGSTSSMAQCIERLVAMTGVPRAQAMRMATTVPGHLVGRRGQLAAGHAADLIRFRWTDSLAIDSVWSAGRHRSDHRM